MPLDAAMLLADLRRELAHAARALTRAPGFTVIAFVTLALGVGATTAIFTVLDAVLLRPLPYREPERLVTILHPATVPGSGERVWGVSPGGYFTFAERNRTLDGIALYRTSAVTITNEDRAEVATVARVTASLFGVLGTRALHGRLLTADDDRPGAPRVAVIGHGLFLRRFGGDPTVIGRTLETTDGGYEIVGVAAADLALPLPDPFAASGDLSGLAADVWLPMRLDPAGPFHNNHPNVGVARMRPGVTVADVQRDLEGIFARFPELLPNAYSTRFLDTYRFRVRAEELQRTVLGPRLPRTIWMLFGAVVLVLAIAAANVAHLYLVRFDARLRETAVRDALGAGTAQLAVHHLSETLLLAGSAAAAGLGLAAAALPLLLRFAPADVPRLAGLTLDLRSVLVAAGTALTLGVVLGVVPLLRRRATAEVLRSGHRGLASSPRQRMLRGALVVGQCAMALTLLTAAGLMLRSFAALRTVAPGYDVRGVLAVDVAMPYTEYGARSASLAFHRALSERLAALPGVVAVGGIGQLPLEGFATGCTVVFREGRPYAGGETVPCVPTPTVAPGAFAALRMQVAGASVAWADIDGDRPVAVVTGALARRLWPGEDPIGKGIGSNGPDSDRWFRVVGVVEDFRGEALDAVPSEAVFYSVGGLRDDDSGELTNFTYLLRTTGDDPLTLVPAVREAVQGLSSRVALDHPRAMEAVLARSMSRTTFLLVLLAVAAGMALLLSAIGLYGVIASIVTHRRPEFGIRLALGATEGSVVRLVLRQSALLVALGLALGVAVSRSVTHLMEALLYGVVPDDPLVLLAAAALLALIGIAASLLPARRAALVPPGVAMQSD